MEFRLSESELQSLLCQVSESLAQSQQNFLSFLNVVQEDIRTKHEQWCGIRRMCDTSQGKNVRVFASIQQFMLLRYQRRISDLREVVMESARRLCREYLEGAEAIDQLIEIHARILVKIKRRLKHMIDVSDKYFLAETVDKMTQLQRSQSASPLDSSLRGKNLQNRSLSLSGSIASCSSDISFDSDSSGSPSPSSSPTSSPSNLSASMFSLSSPPPSLEGGTRPRLKSMSSLLDHVMVLTRTYTQKGESFIMRWE